MEMGDLEMRMRIIVIGCREKWDWKALDTLATWADSNGGEELAKAVWANKLDHYDMTTKPRKGDAYEALRKKTDTVAVIALHLYGLDEKKHPKCADLKNYRCEDGWRYTKHNHKLLNLCLKRNIPFIVVGDQPIYTEAKVPDGILRDKIADPETSCGDYCNRPIYTYRRGAK